MNIPSIIAESQAIISALTRPEIQAITSQHPDADWEITIPRPQTYPIHLNGNIFLSSTRYELSLDITEIANSVDATTWNYIKSLPLFEDDNIKVLLSIVVTQSLEPDEKALLRSLGHLRQIQPDILPYEIIVCEQS